MEVWTSLGLGKLMWMCDCGLALALATLKKSLGSVILGAGGAADMLLSGHGCQHPKWFLPMDQR